MNTVYYNTLGGVELKNAGDSIFDTTCEAAINTVNCEGVMGKGLAKEFSKRFPNMFRDYKQVCNKPGLNPGDLHIHDLGEDHHLGFRYIINFPTKILWRDPSRYEYIELGLEELIKAATHYGWKSIAIPALGCGNGGLDFEKVQGLIFSRFIERIWGSFERVEIYPPDLRSARGMTGPTGPFAGYNTWAEETPGIGTRLPDPNAGDITRAEINTVQEEELRRIFNVPPLNNPPPPPPTNQGGGAGGNARIQFTTPRPVQPNWPLDWTILPDGELDQPF